MVGKVGFALVDAVEFVLLAVVVGFFFLTTSLKESLFWVSYVRSSILFQNKVLIN